MSLREQGADAFGALVDQHVDMAQTFAAHVCADPRLELMAPVAIHIVCFRYRGRGGSEDDLRALGFDRLDLIRPGLLRGDRPGPQRLGEGLATIAAPLTDALLHGSFRRYRSISGDTVAAAIARLARQSGSGVHIHENDAIRALAD